MKFKSGSVLLAALLVASAALVVAGAGWAQAPPSQPAPQSPPQSQPQPAPQPPPQKLPSGIQALPTPSPRDSVAPAEVVLTVGSEKLTRAQLEKVKQDLSAQYPQVQQMTDRAFATNYANLRTLVLQAQSEKLEETQQFKDQRDNLLASMVLQRLQTQSQVVADSEIKTYYDAHLPEMQQLRLSGIYVALSPPAKPGAKPGETPKARTDDEARARALELRKKILAGADFAAVAKAESDDQRTAEKGGDFDVILKGTLAPNIESAIFSLKPKELSEPIKEQQGYFIFRVEEFKTRTLDEATATIRNKLQQDKLDVAIKGIQSLYPVTYNDKYFGPAPPPAPTPAQQPPAAKPGEKPVVREVAPAKAEPAPTKPPATIKPPEKP
jgi:peptidyl-prolyl cis-trans isomerase C